MPQIAVQLYSVLDHSKADLKRTLRELSAIGYDGIELAGGMEFGEKHAQTAWEYGLSIASAHTSLSNLRDSIGREIQKAHKLHVDTLFCQWAFPDAITDFNTVRAFSKELGKYAELLWTEGIRLGYHNHWMEVQTLNGAAPVDEFFKYYEKSRPLMEFDVFWSKLANVDPSSFLRSHRSSCQYLFLKDYVEEGPRPSDTNGIIEKHIKKLQPDISAVQVPVGSGAVDCRGLLELAKDSAEWIVVEQTQYNGKDPFMCLEESCRFIKSVLQGG